MLDTNAVKYLDAIAATVIADFIDNMKENDLSIELFDVDGVQEYYEAFVAQSVSDQMLECLRVRMNRILGKPDETMD